MRATKLIKVLKKLIREVPDADVFIEINLENDIPGGKRGYRWNNACFEITDAKNDLGDILLGYKYSD